MVVDASSGQTPPHTQLLQNFAVSFAARGGGIFVALAVNILLARNLSQSVFAFYGITLSLSVLLVGVVQLGYQSSIVRLAGECRARGDLSALGADIAGALLASLFGGAFVVGLVLGARSWLLPDLDGGAAEVATALLVAGFIVVRGINTLLAEALRGLGHVGLAVLLTGLGQHGGLLRSLLMLALVAGLSALGGLSLVTLLWVSVLASVLAAVIALIVLHGKAPLRLSGRVVLGSIRRNMGLNFHLLFAQTFQLAGGGVMANVIGGAIGLGAGMAPLIAAQQIGNFLAAPLTLVNGAIPALMIKAREAGEPGELEALLRQGATLAFLLTTCAALVFLLAGPGVFALLFGADYVGAYWVFALLVPGFVVNAFAGPAARVLALLGGERPYLVMSSLTVLISIPLFILAGKSGGAPGLATAVSGVLATQNLVLLAVVHRRFGVRSHAYLHPAAYLELIRRAKSRLMQKLHRGKG